VTAPGLLLLSGIDDYSGLVPYTAPMTGPRAILVDLDGTLCLRGDRSPYDETRVGEDAVCEAVLKTVLLYARAGYRVIFMSGRSEVCRPDTEEWLLREYPEEYEALFMRAAGDGRRDWVVKTELFDAHVRADYQVALVLDDRDQVVKAWRALGLPVFQVAEGDF